MLILSIENKNTNTSFVKNIFEVNLASLGHLKSFYN